ncbi:MAG: hypothetical protein L3J98_16990, partial [Gammaproteobacteria bacterium]|nr:hypothetical protein [Gammaproteobacteria bacterium]
RISQIKCVYSLILIGGLMRLSYRFQFSGIKYFQVTSVWLSLAGMCSSPELAAYMNIIDFHFLS